MHLDQQHLEAVFQLGDLRVRQLDFGRRPADRLLLPPRLVRRLVGRRLGRGGRAQACLLDPAGGRLCSDLFRRAGGFGFGWPGAGRLADRRRRGRGARKEEAGGDDGEKLAHHFFSWTVVTSCPETGAFSLGTTVSTSLRSGASQRWAAAWIASGVTARWR